MYPHTRLYSVISYISWLGWVIALILSERSDWMTRHHLNQAFAINIIGIVGSICARFDGVIGWISWIIGAIILVLTIMGIIRAFQLSDKPLPLVGNFKIFK